MWMLIIWVCGSEQCDVHEVAGRYSTMAACQVAGEAIVNADSGFKQGTANPACVPAPDKDPMIFE